MTESGSCMAERVPASGAPTVLRIDPLGRVAARAAAIAASVVAAGAALTITVVTRDQITSPAAQLLALLVLAGACATVIRASSHFRAPFSGRSHLLIVVLLLGAVALNALASWGNNVTVRDDWGPAVMSVILVILGAYRPPQEVAASSIGSAVLIGLLAVHESSDLAQHAPALVTSIVAAAPVLAAGLAGAAFGRRVRILQSRARTSLQLGEGVDCPLAMAIIAERQASLEAEVIPFLAEVVRVEFVTRADSDRARLLASSLRAVMVAEADASWLAGLPIEVDDPQRLANRMSGEQRRALRALIVHLREEQASDRAVGRLSLSEQDTMAHATLRVALPHGGATRMGLAPFMPVLRQFFPGTAVRFSAGELSIDFAFATSDRFQ